MGLGELAQYSFGLGSAALGGGREDGSDSSSFQGFFSIFLLLGFSCILGLGGELVPGDLGACVSGSVLHDRGGGGGGGRGSAALGGRRGRR